MYSSQISNRSSVIIQQTKGNQVNSFGILTRQLNLAQIVSFLAGFIIGELKLTPINKDNSKILHKIRESIELIKDGIVEPRNIIQATIQSLQIIKKMSIKQQQYTQTQKNRPKNKMRSEFQQQVEEEKRTPSQNFLELFAINLSELALDRNYLRNLWAVQTIKEEQQRKSEEAIRRMMEEEEQSYRLKRKEQQQNMEQYNQKLVRKMLDQQQQKMKQVENARLQCQICLVDIDYCDMGTLDCGHIFHRQCLFEHIKASVLNNKIDMACPMEGCNKMIPVRDIEEYLDGDILDKYNKFSLNKYVQMNNSDTSWCPTAGCPALFSFDEDLDNYRCPTCHKHYCLKCKCEYHDKMSCAEYRINNTFSNDDKKFQEFVRGAKYKQCPKCKFWVQRAQGCSTMSCRCGTQFCYDCGGTGCPHGSCSNSGQANFVNNIMPFRGMFRR